MRIGIMSAMVQENLLIAKKLTNVTTQTVASRTYTHGYFMGHEVVIAFSRWGKIASAITSSYLIHQYKVDNIIFTGVTGSCDPSVKVGDIVVANRLIQHDMDARPLFNRFEIPLIQTTHFEVEKSLIHKTKLAAYGFLSNQHAYLEKDQLDNFLIKNPKVHTGLIASGDKFFASKYEVAQLKKDLPELLCVELESASVAQVCHEHQVDFSIIRTISDSADDSSPLDFERFVNTIASPYSLGILEKMLPLI